MPATFYHFRKRLSINIVQIFVKLKFFKYFRVYRCYRRRFAPRPTFLSPFKKFNSFRPLQNGKRYKNYKHYKYYKHYKLYYYSVFLSSNFHILYTISENFVGFCISIGRHVYFGAEAYLCEIGGFRAFFLVDLRCIFRVCRRCRDERDGCCKQKPTVKILLFGSVVLR